MLLEECNERIIEQEIAEPDFTEFSIVMKPKTIHLLTYGINFIGLAHLVIGGHYFLFYLVLLLVIVGFTFIYQYFGGFYVSLVKKAS